MPNRILREAILTSDRIAQLAWPDEVFYRRLMSIVDDYGRHEANPQLLRSKCFPLQTDAVRVADISRWMAACQKAGLIAHYEVLGKQYVEISNFGQQQRTPSKCPPPPNNADPLPASASRCQQSQADAHLGVFVFGGVSVVEGEGEGGEDARAAHASPPDPPPTKRVKDRGPPDCPEGVDRHVWDDWLALRKAKRAPVTATVVEAAGVEAQKAGMTLDAFLRVWCSRGSQGLQAEWLHPADGAKQQPRPLTATERAMTEIAGRSAAPHLRQAHPATPLTEVIDVTPRVLGR